MTSVFDLNNGDCFNSAAEATVDEVAVTDCDNGHEYEIYFAVDYDAGPFESYPGEDAVVNFECDEQCTAQFEAFVGMTYEDRSCTSTTWPPLRIPGAAVTARSCARCTGLTSRARIRC